MTWGLVVEDFRTQVLIKCPTFDRVRLGQLRAVFEQSRRECIPGPWMLASLKSKIHMCT